MYEKQFRTAGKLRPLYQAWKDMHFRCTAGNRYHKRYFLRGITVTEEWSDWPIFATWALANGWKRGLEIDRRNNDAGYSPGNCRFVDHKTQNRNRDLALAHQGIREGQTRRWHRPFRCVETGEVFVTQIQAYRKHGVDRKSLRMALSGVYEQAGGKRWEYLSQEAPRRKS